MCETLVCTGFPTLGLGFPLRAISCQMKYEVDDEEEPGEGIPKVCTMSEILSINQSIDIHWSDLTSFTYDARIRALAY